MSSSNSKPGQDKTSLKSRNSNKVNYRCNKYVSCGVLHNGNMTRVFSKIMHYLRTSFFNL